MPTYVQTELQDLPEELLGEFATHTINVDLLALRSTCRKLNRATDDCFLARFFSKRVHMCSKHSLDVLKVIAQDDRFAKKVETIQIVTQIPITYWTHPTRDLARYDQDDSFSETIAGTFSSLAALGKTISLAVRNEAEG